MTAILGTAFAFGLVATVNPCGFAMLPAYLSAFLGSAGDRPELRVRRALQVSGLMSIGFLVVFGVAGVLLSAGVRVIIEWIPWAAVVVGAVLVVLGIRTFRGRPPTFQFGSGRVNRNSVVGFGVSYAVASLSCTLPIFLSLVAGTFAQTSFLGGVAAFLVYGAGTALVITTLTVAMAFGEDRLTKVIRKSARFVPTVSGVVLTASGLFIIWYWSTVLSAGAVGLGTNPLVRWVDRVSSSITSAVADRPVTVALVLLAVAVAALAALRHSRRDESRASEHPSDAAAIGNR